MNKYEIVKKYIDEYDYYGLLAGNAPDNEFDSYSYKLTEMISEDDSVLEIASLIANLLDNAFGMEVQPAKFIETAKKIKAAMNSY